MKKLINKKEEETPKKGKVLPEKDEYDANEVVSVEPIDGEVYSQEIIEAIPMEEKEGMLSKIGGVIDSALNSPNSPLTQISYGAQDTMTDMANIMGAKLEPDTQNLPEGLAGKAGRLVGQMAAPLTGGMGYTPALELMQIAEALPLVGPSVAAGKGLIKKAADYIPKQMVKLANTGLRSEVLEEAFKNPHLLQKATKTLDQAGAAAHNGIKYVEETLGKLVGQAKAQLKGTNIKIDLEPLEKIVANLEKSVGITGAKDDILLETDKNGIKAFQMIKKYTKDVFKEKIIKKESSLVDEIGKPLSVETKNIGKPVDLERANQALRNIDSSQEFQTIYDKMVFDKSLTQAESAALRARNAFSESINKTESVLFDKAGLGDKKEAYSAFKSTIDDPLVRLMQKSKDQATSVIKNSLSAGKQERYKILRDIESTLPKSNHFMDDVIRNGLEGVGINPLEKSSIINGTLNAFAKGYLSPASQITTTSLKAGKSLIKKVAPRSYIQATGEGD